MSTKNVKVYEYANCSTCKKALKFLDEKKIDFNAVAIVDHPPSVAELKTMLAHQKGELKKLFNTSGQLYRELGVAEKLPTMTEAQALALLSKNGKLIKRPFLLTATHGLVGFKEEQWKKVFS